MTNFNHSSCPKYLTLVVSSIANYQYRLIEDILGQNIETYESDSLLHFIYLNEHPELLGTEIYDLTMKSIANYQYRLIEDILGQNIETYEDYSLLKFETLNNNAERLDVDWYSLKIRFDFDDCNTSMKDLTVFSLPNLKSRVLKDMTGMLFSSIKNISMNKLFYLNRDPKYLNTEVYDLCVRSIKNYKRRIIRDLQSISFNQIKNYIVRELFDFNINSQSLDTEIFSFNLR